MYARAHILAVFCLLLGIESSAQTGIFVEPPQYPTGFGPLGVAVGDFNGDGKLDLAVTNICPATGCGGTSNGFVSILMGNGDGTFQPPVDYAVPGATMIAVADFDGDGTLDLAVTDGAGFSVLLGSGDGTFQAPVNYGAGGAGRHLVGCR